MAFAGQDWRYRLGQSTSIGLGFQGSRADEAWDMVLGLSTFLGWIVALFFCGAALVADSMLGWRLDACREVAGQN